MGAEIVVFHPAYYGKLKPEECYQLVKKECENMADKLKEKGIIRFSDLVATWKRKEIIRLFLPVLALVNRGTIECEQEDMFKDIYIKLR